MEGFGTPINRITNGTRRAWFRIIKTWLEALLETGFSESLCYNTAHRRPSTPNSQHIRAPLDAVINSIAGGSLSALLELRRRALEESLPVYLVGGPVRDVLMGMPIKDLDFVVEGDAPQIASQLAQLLAGQVVVHSTFGTASVILEDAHIDLVTARREIYPRPGALPQVTPSGIDDDLSRRDFTINALALPFGQENPQHLDPHGGIADIRSGNVRALHPESFVDDPTRMLRAVRYEQRLGFRIESGTLDQIGEAVAQGRICTVSGDRWRNEIQRILEEERPGLALNRAAILGILAGIHPSLTNVESVDRLAAREPGSSVMAVGQMPGLREPLMHLAALVYPLSPVDAEGVIHRLNMPSPWMQTVRDTVELKRHEARIADQSLSGSQLARLVEPYVEPAVQAVSLITESPVVAQQLTWYLKDLRHISPKLDGRDLLALGVPSGPLMGQILKDLRDARLDGRVETEDEERGLAQELLARGGQIGHG